MKRRTPRSLSACNVGKASAKGGWTKIAAALCASNSATSAAFAGCSGAISAACVAKSTPALSR